MQFVFQTEADIAAPPERVFQTLGDLDSAEEWMQGIVSIEKTTDGPFGVGAAWKETRRMYGKNATELMEVAAYEPPKKVSVYVDGSKGSTGKGEYTFDYIVTPQGEGSHVVIDADIIIPGLFAAVFGRLFIGSFKKAIAKDLQAMKEYIEKEKETAAA